MRADGKPTFLGEDADRWMLKYFSFLVEEFGFEITGHGYTELTQGDRDHTSAAISFVREDRRFTIFYWEGRGHPELYLEIAKGDFTNIYAKSEKQSIMNIVFRKNIDFDFFANLPQYTSNLEISLSRFAEFVWEHCMDVFLGSIWFPNDQDVAMKLYRKSSTYKPTEGRTGKPFSS